MSNNYTGLKRIGQTIKDARMPVRCAEKLLELRKSLQPICKQKSDLSLLLATWNIRDFDSNKFGFGPRLDESFYYIAEIISAFDLVALQEITRDLAPLERLMRILGREWDYIVTDVTEGTGGSNERMAFVFNTEKVWFRKVAGEIVLPEGQLIVARKKVSAKKADGEEKAAKPEISAEAAKKVKKEFKEVQQQFARSPFLVAFQSGWFRFSLCTVHIYYGAESGEKLEQRISEIQQLMKFFAKRQDSEIKSAEDKGDPRSIENYILLGDFNVVSPEHKTMQALKSEGFIVPAAIDGKKVRDDESHYYDQIAVRVKDDRFNVVTGGLVDAFDVVFRDTDEDFKTYEKFMPKKDPEAKAGSKATPARTLYRKWRTWQMSDHNPLWIKIDTDFADHYLREITEQARS